MPVRLVCLDAGFTLLSPRRTLADALSGVLADHGHSLSEESLRSAWEAADRWFWDDYHRPDNDTWADDARIDETWRRYHGLMLRELGVADPAPEILERILASQFAPDAWELYPDVLPMLDLLRSVTPGLIIGVVSDWGSNLHAITKALGLDPRLDFVLASGSAGVAKPNPAFFRLALERAGVEAVDAVMVGDSYRADVLGARSAGMSAILLDREGTSTEGDVTTVRGLDELPAIVAPAGVGVRPP